MTLSVPKFAASLLAIALFGASRIADAQGLIAYTSSPANNVEIYVMNSDGSGQTRLTNHPALDLYPSLSPNGASIVFERRDFTNLDNWGLYLMKSDGSGLKRLTFGREDMAPAFTSDGKKISFFRFSEGKLTFNLMNPDGTRRETIENAAITQLADVNDVPRLSPDGSKIAFRGIARDENGNSTGQHLYIVNRDGSNLIRVSGSLKISQGPAWNKDGSSIAFSGAVSDTSVYRIYTAKPDGSDLAILSEGNPFFSDLSPVYSPSQDKLAFVSMASNEFQIFTMNSDGTGRLQLTDASPSSLPSWSAGGAPLTSGFSVSNVRVKEGNDGTSQAIFTVRLVGVREGTQSISFKTADGTAIAGSDYTATEGVLTFGPDDQTKTVVVPITGDTGGEADEKFTLNLSEPVGATIGDAEGVATIVNDDVLPSISVSDASIMEGAAGEARNLTFILTLSAPNAYPVSVTCSTKAAGSPAADAKSDYRELPPTVVTFVPGATSQIISVPIVGDNNLERNEQFGLQLKNPVNAILKKGSALGTIINDDVKAAPAPRISVADVSVVEGDSGKTYLVYEVTLSSRSDQVVTVKHQVVPGVKNPASKTVDYFDPGTRVLAIAPGQTKENIYIEVRPDRIYEADETLALSLSAPTNATISRSQAIGTIKNDDLPSVTGYAPNVTEGNGDGPPNTMAITLTLSASSPRPVTVEYSTEEGPGFPAESGVDFVAVPPTKVTFLPGQTVKTVRVQIIGDKVPEHDENFFLRIKPIDGAVVPRSLVYCAIRNDDKMRKVSIQDATAIEGDAGKGKMSFRVSLDQKSEQPITVKFMTLPIAGGATAGGDYSSVTGEIVFAPGEVEKTIDISILGDKIAEDSESFQVVLTEAYVAEVVDKFGTGIIIDNDAATTAESSASSSSAAKS